MVKLTLMGAVAQERSGYSIVFLDAGGCASCGDTLAEVLEMGKEALEGWLAVALDYGDSVPVPTQHSLADVEAWLYEDEPADAERGTWLGLYPITVEIPEQRTTTAIRVKADLVERIAKLADVPLSRVDSARFIEDAVEHEIERLRKSA